jgi:hypothetical protein
MAALLAGHSVDELRSALCSVHLHAAERCAGFIMELMDGE